MSVNRKSGTVQVDKYGISSFSPRCAEVSFWVVYIALADDWKV